MHTKACCVSWQDLAGELSSAKLAEIDLMIKEKGIPRSVFALVSRTLENMENFCPVCGTNLQVAPVPTAEEIKEIVRPTVATEPNKVRTPHTCPRCHGRGKVQGYPDMNCSGCLGEGKIRPGQNTVLDDGGSFGEVGTVKGDI